MQALSRGCYEAGQTPTARARLPLGGKPRFLSAGRLAVRTRAEDKSRCHLRYRRGPKALLDRLHRLIQPPMQRAKLALVRRIVQRALRYTTDRIDRLDDLIDRQFLRRDSQGK